VNLWLSQNANQVGGLTVQLAKIDEGSTVAVGKAAIANAIKAGSVDVLVGIANSD